MHISQTHLKPVARNQKKKKQTNRKGTKIFSPIIICYKILAAVGQLGQVVVTNCMENMSIKLYFG